MPRGDAPTPAKDTPPDSGGLSLSSRLTGLPGIGRRRDEALARLGLRTVSDLLRHTPMRYEHEAAEGVIAQVVIGQTAAVRGEVAGARWVGGPGRKGRFEAIVRDPSGTLQIVWFNAGYLREKVHPGMRLWLQGPVKAYGGYPQMVNPRWERLPDEPGADPAPTDDRLRPVYPASTEAPSKVIEQAVNAALDRLGGAIPDPLPTDLLSHHNMPALDAAIRMLHRPAHADEAAAARRRLAYNELLLLQLGVAIRRAYVEHRLVAPPLHSHPGIDEHIRQRFPFPLTEAQDRVIGEIRADLARDRPMNRMLQGDVGAGKTVVALYAMLLAVAERKQAAMMAPTELLAEQHELSIRRMLEGTSVRLALLTSGAAGAAAQRAELERAIAAGEVDIVVGTHALLSASVRFADLALAVVDEQHRFGVQQRAALRHRGPADPAHGRTRAPHQLVMTATPIPRTLSLTVFGDLDVSTIRGLPPGRMPITTRVVGPAQREEVYAYLKTRLARGEQAYVVVPLIDADETEAERSLASVAQHAEMLRGVLGPKHRVEAVHGRLDRGEREAVMTRFHQGAARVLVATTVIEVGVDVPNATVMVIEHAERFGLAQLHQLRGRVGRGTHGRRSLCVLIGEPTTEAAQQRLDAIASTADGFKIAELDLQIRGMGEFFGTRQHGAPPLRTAEIPRDMDLLQLARRDARAITAQDPTLDRPEHRLLRRVLLQQFGEALGLADVG